MKMSIGPAAFAPRADANSGEMRAAETGEQLRPPLDGHQGPASSVVFSPDGKRIVSNISTGDGEEGAIILILVLSFWW
jgi:WD40 repeat protein